MDLHIGRGLSAAEIAHLLAEARGRTLLLTASCTPEDLRLQHDPLMSPIVWDLGHIGHFEDVWLRQNVTGADSGTEGLSGIYNPFENPRATRDSLPLPTLQEAKEYMARIRRAVLARVDGLDLTGSTSLLDHAFVFRMVLQHEYQHNETILQTLQLKVGEAYAAPRSLVAPDLDPSAPPIGSRVRFPGGRIAIGTDDRSTAYDNERPLYEIEVAPFHMDVHPTTNGEFLQFVDDGGYRERAFWSDEGWAFVQEQALTAPKYWAQGLEGWTERSFDRIAPLAHSRPVIHLCYWEAEAYARWAGKRLPTEVEWETAASWDAEFGGKSEYPWGDEAPTPSHANLDALLFETAPIGTYPMGVSPMGCWGMMGDTWEWTSSDFGGYPGYRMFPYPEYSEVFFGNEYKVLRGGSWATRHGAVRNTFRNWDYPIRRQIFSGVRCASDD